MSEEIMTVKQLSDYLKMSQHVIYKKVRKGEIPSSRIGKCWRFQKSAIDRWLSEELAIRKVKEPLLPLFERFKGKK